jgi:hypothetical protein
MGNRDLDFPLAMHALTPASRPVQPERHCTIRFFTQNKHLLLDLLGFFDNLSLSIILEASSRYLIKSQDLLVRVLDKHVLALWTLQTHVGDCSDDTPTVGEREVHL